MDEIKTVIEDLNMLKDEIWIPDDDSCNASINVLETALEKSNNYIYSIKALISLLKQTTEYEVLQSFRDKVEKIQNNIKN